MWKDKIQQELLQPKPSIVALIDFLILEALEDTVSDIHIDPTDVHIHVRYRIDGKLIEKYVFEKIYLNEIISRIKILSRLRTDEHKLPQDGRFRFTHNSSVVDMRVSIIATFYGENAVLRLLRDTVGGHTLESLGLSPPDQAKIIQALKRPYGMILTTGPTGSGKTTTLYTLLKILNTSERSIITIEDPIEYSITGVRQIQAYPSKGLTFAQGLRAMVRQDPDIIMLGEIRDAETASVAINTALTGHLLLSTMHTNDSATTLIRLIDMGIDPYLIASTVELVIAQRLVRKLCEYCKDTNDKKCEICNFTGFKGRIGMYEILSIDEHMRSLIMQKAPHHEIKKYARLHGMKELSDYGKEYVKKNITSQEEIVNTFYV